MNIQFPNTGVHKYVCVCVVMVLVQRKLHYTSPSLGHCQAVPALEHSTLHDTVLSMERACALHEWFVYKRELQLLKLGSDVWVMFEKSHIMLSTSLVQ